MPRYIDADLITYVESENGVLDDFAYRYDINEIPTADVVPKSEVAREIFKEMQSCLIQRHWNGLDIISFEFDAVKYAELKKKYTEGEPNERNA